MEIQNRRDLVKAAVTLERITIVWMICEAGIALFSGILAHSLTLVAFGADSLVELISAVVLLWRLNHELKNGKEMSEGAEKRASQIGGLLLFALALYVLISACLGLWHKSGSEFSIPGLAISVLAIPVMFFLAKRKLKIAGLIQSKALRADAFESITCAYLSFVVVAGLFAQLIFKAWWVDGVTSLLIVYFLVKEGLEAWSGEECSHCENDSKD